MAKRATGAIGEVAPGVKDNKYFKAADKIANGGHAVTQALKNPLDSYREAN